MNLKRLEFIKLGGITMAGSLKKGVHITGFIGGNCNGSTGDFSYGIEGFLVENESLKIPSLLFENTDLSGL